MPQLLKFPLASGALHGECMTIHGKTMAEMLMDVAAEPRKNQDLIRSWAKPHYQEGHLAIVKGNLAPKGCVVKITGLNNPAITVPARVFDSENDCMQAILAKRIKPGDVVAIRYDGPKGDRGYRKCQPRQRKAPKPRCASGVMATYTRLLSSASKGAITEGGG